MILIKIFCYYSRYCSGRRDALPVCTPSPWPVSWSAGHPTTSPLYSGNLIRVCLLFYIACTQIKLRISLHMCAFYFLLPSDIGTMIIIFQSSIFRNIQKYKSEYDRLSVLAQITNKREEGLKSLNVNQFNAKVSWAYIVYIRL